jgi:hypothetical protein
MEAQHFPAAQTKEPMRVSESRHARQLNPRGGSSGRRSCPPHGPLLGRGTGEVERVIECLKCGLLGSEFEDFSVTRDVAGEVP